MSSLTLDADVPVPELSAADKAAATKQLYDYEPYLDPSKKSSSRPWYLTPKKGYMASFDGFLSSMNLSLASQDRPTGTKTRSRSRIALLPSEDIDMGDEAALKPEEIQFIWLTRSFNQMMKTLALVANTGVETDQELYRKARGSLLDVSQQVYKFSSVEGSDEHSQEIRAILCVEIAENCEKLLPDLRGMEAEIERLRKSFHP